MKSIINTTMELINKKNDFVTFDEIIANIDNKEFNKEEIKAIIYSDLLTDGRFFLKEGEWNLKENFTIKELNKIRSQGIVDDLLFNDEIEIEKEEETIKLDTEIIEEDLFDDDEEIDIAEIVDEEVFEEAEAVIND